METIRTRDALGEEVFISGGSREDDLGIEAHNLKMSRAHAYRKYRGYREGRKHLLIITDRRLICLPRAEKRSDEVRKWARLAALVMLGPVIGAGAAAGIGMPTEKAVRQLVEGKEYESALLDELVGAYNGVYLEHKNIRSIQLHKAGTSLIARSTYRMIRVDGVDQDGRETTLEWWAYEEKSALKLVDYMSFSRSDVALVE